MMKSFGHNLRRLSSADAVASKSAVFVQPEIKKSSLKRGASLGNSDSKNFRKAETENRDENETDDLIAVTKQKINKE